MPNTQTETKPEALAIDADLAALRLERDELRIRVADQERRNRELYSQLHSARYERDSLQDEVEELRRAETSIHQPPPAAQPQARVGAIQGNVLTNGAFADWRGGKPNAWRLHEVAKTLLLYDRVRAIQKPAAAFSGALRIRALKLETTSGATTGEITILSQTLPDPQILSADDLELVLTARSAAGESRLTIKVEQANGQALAEASFRLDRDWQTLRHRWKPSDLGAAESAAELVLTLSMPLTQTLQTLEIGALVLARGDALGAGKVDAPAAVEQPRVGPVFHPGDIVTTSGEYVRSNLLLNGELALAPGAPAEKPPASWRFLSGKKKKARVIFYDDAMVTSGHEAAVLPRRHLTVQLDSNPTYARLYQLFSKEQTDRLARLAETQRKIGAETYIAAVGDPTVSVNLFLLANLGNEEEVFWLVRKARPAPENWRRYEAIETVTPGFLKALKNARRVMLVIELSGRGKLRLGPCWLGDGWYLAPLRRGLDRRREETWAAWRYHRYLATAETRAVGGSHHPRIVAVVYASFSDLAEEPTNHTSMSTLVTALARSVRSAITVAEAVYVCLVAQAEGAHARSCAERLAASHASAMSQEQRSTVTLGVFHSESEVETALPAELADRQDHYLVVLEPGDVLRSDFAHYLDAGRLEADPPPDVYVIDHDTIDAAGERHTPRFKPGVSPHLLLEHDYVERGVCYRIGTLIGETGSWRGRSPLTRLGSRDCLLRLIDENRSVLKVDQVLLHCAQRQRDRFAALAQDRVFITETLKRRGYNPDQHNLIIDRGNRLNVRYPVPGEPLVSIIIPFKDGLELLRPCVESILHRSSYRKIEILLVDNRSSDPETLEYLAELTRHQQVRRVRFDRAFNYSRANNLGARQAEGDYFIFLNNDTEIVTPDWIENLVGYAALPETAFAGAKLHYAEGTIQHAGIVVGHGDLAGHALAGQHDVWCPRELAFHTRDVSAVTAAACCIKSERYWELGGFDERFIVTGNDVALNLKALSEGYRNIIVPSVQIFHLEKSTRRNIEIYNRDIALSLAHYEPCLSQGDPYWNKCFTTQSLDWTPRSLVETTPSEIRARNVRRREQAMLALNTGQDTGFLARYDLSRQVIRENQELAAAFARGPRTEIKHVAWFLPGLDHVFRGGVFTVFRFAAHLWRAHGVRSTFVICDHKKPNLDKIRGQCEEFFSDVPMKLFHFDPISQDVGVIPAADAGVCTLWTTAYLMAHYWRCQAKFYLMQDYEPLFMTSGAGYGLVEQTYRLGYFGICNSPGVGEMLLSYGNQHVLAFRPAVDRAVFHPGQASRRQPGSPVRIVFYGRPDKPRNAFSLGIQALSEIGSIYGDDVEIISVGAEFDPADYKIAGVVHNAGLLPDIESVARLYRSADIGLVFMQSKHPSYQPLEYMASGCVTVTNINEANRWLLRDRDNCLLTPMTLTATVETLVEAIDDPELRAGIVSRGLETVAGLDWETVEEQVAAFITRLEVPEPSAARETVKDGRGA